MRAAPGERAEEGHLQRFTEKKGHPKVGCPHKEIGVGYFLGCPRRRPIVPRPSRPKPIKANDAGSGTGFWLLMQFVPVQTELLEKPSGPVPKDTTTLLTT